MNLASEYYFKLHLKRSSGFLDGLFSLIAEKKYFFKKSNIQYFYLVQVKTVTRKNHFNSFFPMKNNSGFFLIKKYNKNYDKDKTFFIYLLVNNSMKES